MEKLSGVSMVNGDIMVKTATLGKEQPGRELYKELEKDLPRGWSERSKAATARTIEELALTVTKTVSADKKSGATRIDRRS